MSEVLQEKAKALPSGRDGHTGNLISMELKIRQMSDIGCVESKAESLNHTPRFQEDSLSGLVSEAECEQKYGGERQQVLQDLVAGWVFLQSSGRG